MSRAAAPSAARLASAATFSRNRGGDASLCDRVNEQNKDSVSLRSHRIVRGDSLSAIAVLYGTTVQALTAANALRHDAVIRIGQELVIPQQARPGGGDDWLKYARSPEKPGAVTLIAYRSQYRGQVLEKGRISPAAKSAISALLGVKGSRPPVPERLLRLLVRVSDTFGGRPIRVVSGYRSSSYFADSRHKHSAAVDFSIPGVPNAILRQYLLLFDDAGVGYYPNSSFIHLDVRDCAIQWTDYAGPGQAPRQRPFTPRYATGSRLAKSSPVAAELNELDEIADNAAAALDEAASPHLNAPTLREATLPREPPVRAAQAPSDDAPAPSDAVAARER